MAQEQPRLFCKSALTPVVDLLLEIIPVLTPLKFKNYAQPWFDYFAANPGLLQQNPAMKKAFDLLRDCMQCTYCSNQPANSELDCGHSICDPCFLNHVSTTTQGFAIYNSIEAHHLPPLVCKLCQVPISSKTLAKNLPNYEDLVQAANIRFSNSTQVCRDCKDPSQVKSSQHPCVCRVCFLKNLLANNTHCKHCGEEYSSTHLQAEAFDDPELTINCRKCELPVPLEYILQKDCCQEFTCVVCQIVHSEVSENKGCMWCGKEIQLKAGKQIKLVEQELEGMSDLEPGLFS